MNNYFRDGKNRGRTEEKWTDRLPDEWECIILVKLIKRQKTADGRKKGGLPDE